MILYVFVIAFQRDRKVNYINCKYGATRKFKLHCVKEGIDILWSEPHDVPELCLKPNGKRFKFEIVSSGLLKPNANA